MQEQQLFREYKEYRFQKLPNTNSCFQNLTVIILFLLEK